MKPCVECGTVFNAIGRINSCSEKCRKERKKRYDLVYNTEYYMKNSEKWRWYYENRRVRDWGTGGLGEKATKECDGSIDFHAERIKIAKEMRKLGLRK